MTSAGFRSLHQHIGRRIYPAHARHKHKISSAHTQTPAACRLGGTRWQQNLNSLRRHAVELM
jgi:hypothetical protein